MMLDVFNNTINSIPYLFYIGCKYFFRARVNNKHNIFHNIHNKNVVSYKLYACIP
jgi:hypothetical protein